MPSVMGLAVLPSENPAEAHYVNIRLLCSLYVSSTGWCTLLPGISLSPVTALPLTMFFKSGTSKVGLQMTQTAII